jgi:hypothetical protein
MSLPDVPVMVHVGREAASVEGTDAKSDVSKIATIAMNENFRMADPFITDTYSAYCQWTLAHHEGDIGLGQLTIA